MSGKVAGGGKGHPAVGALSDIDGDAAHDEEGAEEADEYDGHRRAHLDFRVKLKRRWWRVGGSDLCGGVGREREEQSHSEENDSMTHLGKLSNWVVLIHGEFDF